MHADHPPLDDSPLAPSRLSPALAVTGLLMVSVLFIYANPGFGVQERVWPWELMAKGISSLLVETVLMLWVITGFWALGMAFSRAVWVRAMGATMLGAILLVNVCGNTGGMTIKLYNLNKMIPMIMLGGGLLLAREPASRLAGRFTAGGGALLLIWALLTGFADGSPSAQLPSFLRELGIVLQDPGHEFPDSKNHLWWVIVPQGLVLLGAAFGLLALLGLTGRRMATIGFILVFAGLLAPGVAGFVLRQMEGEGLRALLEESTALMVDRGLLLWMFGAFTIQDFGRLKSLGGTA